LKTRNNLPVLREDERNHQDDDDIEKLQSEAMKGAKTSPLHNLLCFRIVLDEAHDIKFRNSSTAC